MNSSTRVYRSSKYKNLRSTCLSSDNEKQEPVVKQDLIFEGDADKIIKRYFWAVGLQRDRINKIFRSVYRENLNIKESRLTDTYLAIKAIEQRNKMSIQNIAQELRDYVGYDIEFFRPWEDGMMHPIRIEVIEKAYTMMKLNSPIVDIEKCLFLKFKVNELNTRTRQEVENTMLQVQLTA